MKNYLIFLSVIRLVAASESFAAIHGTKTAAVALAKTLLQGRYVGLNNCMIVADYRPVDGAANSRVSIRDTYGRTASFNLSWATNLTYEELKPGYISLTSYRAIDKASQSLQVQRDNSGLDIAIRVPNGNFVECTVKFNPLR